MPNKIIEGDVLYDVECIKCGETEPFLQEIKDHVCKKCQDKFKSHENEEDLHGSEF